jgi:hypothetical protein
MRSSFTPALVAGALSICAPAAYPQAFSIDFGFQAGVPGIDFRGASTRDAPQSGIWLIPTTDGNAIDFNGLFDTTFTPTDVHLRSDRALDSTFNPGIFGDSDIVGLVADGIYIGQPSRHPGAGRGLSNSGPVTLTLDNIQNGFYEIITYTAPFLDLQAIVEVDINGDTQTAGGSFPPVFFEEGVTHTRHRLEITDNLLTMRFETVTGLGVINGFQIIPIPAPATLTPFALLCCARRRRA